MDDRALVDAIRSGDRGAFGAFVEHETQAVYRICLRILGHAQDAEDVTQEAFVAAYRSIGGYRGDGPLRGWLMRIATRQAYRRIGTRRATVDVASVPEPALADSSGEPTGLVVAAERDRTVRLAVAELAEPYREVVALRFFGDLSLAEVADATGRPLNTVKTHLRRGLDRLRPVLGTTGSDR